VLALTYGAGLRVSRLSARLASRTFYYVLSINAGDFSGLAAPGTARLDYDTRYMKDEPSKPSVQFGLKSLLMGFVWLAFILGICVQYQRTTMKQRAIREELNAAGFWPVAPPGGPAISRVHRSGAAVRQSAVSP
jgi:hypothetical protein